MLSRSQVTSLKGHRPPGSILRLVHSLNGADVEMFMTSIGGESIWTFTFFNCAASSQAASTLVTDFTVLYFTVGSAGNPLQSKVLLGVNDNTESVP